MIVDIASHAVAACARGDLEPGGLDSTANAHACIALAVHQEVNPWLLRLAACMLAWSALCSLGGGAVVFRFKLCRAGIRCAAGADARHND